MTTVTQAVAERIPMLDRPVVVGIDGGDGAGKTRFADALARALEEGGRTVGRGGIDDYLRPQAYRHALGRTPQTVWERSTDLSAVRRELVDPWRARTDGGVLVVDGVFLQRTELRDVWDLVVWLEVPDAVQVSRLAARDGSIDDVADPGQLRYLGAQRIYRDLCDPAVRADVLVDNTDWARPVLLRG